MHICGAMGRWANSLAPGRCGSNFKSTIIKLITEYSSLGTHCEMDGSQVNATEPHHWDVNIVSGNGLVPSGNKPLPEPMFTQISGCHHMVSLSPIELTWLRQNGQHFTDDIFKCPCFNEDHCIAIKVSLKFVSKSYMNNKSSLIQLICRNRQQGITLTNAYLLWIGSLTENYFQNESCKKTSIVFRPKYVEPIQCQSELGFSLFSKYLKRNKYSSHLFCLNLIDRSSS